MGKEGQTDRQTEGGRVGRWGGLGQDGHREEERKKERPRSPQGEKSALCCASACVFYSWGFFFDTCPIFFMRTCTHSGETDTPGSVSTPQSLALSRSHVRMTLQFQSVALDSNACAFSFFFFFFLFRTQFHGVTSCAK